MQPPLLEKKESLELPYPEEKLLRPPTFFEKFSWIKPSVIVLLLITTLISSIYYLLKIENSSTRTKNTQPVISATPSPIISPSDPNAGWKTYISPEGKYSIKYPFDYTLSQTSPDSSTISNILPNFKLTITHKPSDNKTLPQLIEENKICDISPAQGKPAVVNGIKPAQLYLDNSCGSYITTVAYTINNETLYIISVEAQSIYNEVKQETDKILATLKFIEPAETSPKPSCRPRPACLDSVPRCMIVETPDMCPKTTPIRTEGKICGGIAGIQCPTDYQCKLEGNYPDASGICIINSKITPEQIACPADAKQCSDGSWVPRTGPKCEFICPLNELSENEKNKIEAWITENQLNIYGDPKDTGYAGGTPLFDESTGETKDRFKYILEKHPDRPWNK